MTPEEDKIFGAFPECLLAPLEGVPTYEYMTNLNVYLNLCLSAVDFMLVCRTLGYLVLTAQPAVFNTHCVTPFITPRNPGIHPVMPNPTPTAAMISELVRMHKHHVCLFNEYHAVDRACKKFIISEYAELKEEDIQKIDRKIKEPISVETMFEEFVEQIEWNQEAVAV